MNKCPTCGHSRLVHDSWGCKTKCGCSVSIVYITPNLFVEVVNKSEEQDAIDQGNLLDVQADKVEEYRVRMIARRAAAEYHQATTERLS